ncbi:hypothetical protein B0I35DRAFT_425774 [Stachybotrys elegans]|uniref:Uncharacterized protein n=1 Tax=Stachybotrys elegans TaxID=80388 RepID=A0A8K0WSI0_9HYPO|nr:hypothetical protein B0I35DRAFT_425774 [Stachybotrys elegans]
MSRLPLTRFVGGTVYVALCQVSIATTAYKWVFHHLGGLVPMPRSVHQLFWFRSCPLPPRLRRRCCPPTIRHTHLDLVSQERTCPAHCALGNDERCGPSLAPATNTVINGRESQ